MELEHELDIGGENTIGKEHELRKKYIRRLIFHGFSKRFFNFHIFFKDSGRTINQYNFKHSTSNLFNKV
jgi:hypothetical protein